jgi:predicted transcriptional regulator of viral defense system
MLSRWEKSGKIFRLKNNYYSIKKINSKYKLQKVFQNTYIGLYSALEYYQSTTQRFDNLDLISKNNLKNQNINNVNILFNKAKSNIFFGYVKAIENNTEFFISNIEKTLIDCIYFSSKVYISEINEFIRLNKDKIDLDLLMFYLQKINSSTVFKRIGFLLEKHGIDLYKNKKNIKLDNKYVKLNKNLNGKEILKDKKWKIIINETIE